MQKKKQLMKYSTIYLPTSYMVRTKKKNCRHCLKRIYKVPIYKHKFPSS